MEPSPCSCLFLASSPPHERRADLPRSDSSNGGVFGSLYGTPIINTPQAAVLGALPHFLVCSAPAS